MLRFNVTLIIRNRAEKLTPSLVKESANAVDV